MSTTLPMRGAASNDLLSATATVAGADVASRLAQVEQGGSDPYAIDPATARVLVVDDEPINVEVVSAYLSEEGYENIITYTDSVAALVALEQQDFDVALLDIMMPRISGLDLLQQMRASKRLCHIPSIVLTASTDRASKRRAIELGAADFLNKPFDPEELVSRTKNALIRKAHHDQMLNHARDLERRVEQRTAELVASQVQIIHCLGRVAEYRDHRTGQHALRVGRYSGVIASHLGLSQTTVRQLELAATLHDIGKVGVPDSILHKQEPLTADEQSSLRQHAVLGYQMMTPQDAWQSDFCEPAQRRSNHAQGADSSLLNLAATIAATHHEHWDGTGYPNGLAGEAIPLPGRIVAIADAFDHFSSSRTTEPTCDFNSSVARILAGKERLFDPAIVAAFLQGLSEVSSISLRYRDEVRAR